MEEIFYILFAVAAGLYVLVGPGLGIAAFFRGGEGTNAQLAALRKRIDDLTAELVALRRQVAGETGGDAAPPQEAEPETPVPPQPSAAAEPSALWPTKPSPPEPSQPETAPPEEAREAVPPAESPAGPVDPWLDAPEAKPGRSIEQWLTSRGLIWLGGITLALAGLFLAKYTYERGWLALGPGARVTSGFLFGVALAGAGEWLRRRPLQRAIAAIGPNYLPPALTAAGLFSAFGSVYAAYGLYGLLSPLVAFGLLALVAFAAFGLAVIQGPFIAVLALLGGFVTPLLVTSPDPSAWGLFAYLWVLTATALALVRHLACWWLAWGALAGALLWPLFWFTAVWSAGDAAALGTYVLLLAAAFLALRYRAETAGESAKTISVPDQIAWAGALGAALLGFVLLRMDGYGPVSLTAVFLLVCLYLAAGLRDQVFEGLAVVGAVLVTAFMALWHLPGIVDWPERVHSYQGGESYGTDLGPVVPPALTAFVLVALVFGALFAVVGFFALARARRSEIWAGTSAAVPVLLLAIAYWRITGLGIDLAWSAAAAGVAALGLLAAAQLRRRPARPAEDNNLLIGIYALGSVAALSLAMAMVLEQAWLTVALSLQLPAIAWISARLKLTALRPVALIVAAVVLIRLVVNYNVLSYPLGGLPGFNWVLYGYGLPMLAFWWSARSFRKAADDRLVLVLETGTLVLFWLLVTFQIRSLVVGDLANPSYELAEQSLQTVAWLGMAYGWLRAYRRSGRAVLLWGWRLLAGLAALHSPLFQVLLFNPLWTSAAVGDWPLVNLLALAYLVPAGFALAFAWELRAEGHRRSAQAAAVYALFLVFFYLSLEVRRAFHGPLLDVGVTSDGELLTYSLVWLAYAWVLLGLGLKTGLPSLRYASLAVLTLATAKVLLFDWGTLAGLPRFTSFAALGFSLVGIPFLYQKLVFPPAAPEEAPEEPSGEPGGEASADRVS
ncbi:DUF2339 domain-containing protein [Pelagibius litoralis]|uniref:DUF2339 domain-containing protein n=1 Tax=Pelagibius litoralis TaxID=374515 RepID=A0A967EVH4_9PROT|nr:DUF2339 domain-containing protein [Pelagibius litoralis]NIA68676.1 DUF2339 domain-containing protein [Pelagibius litoralis]